MHQAATGSSSHGEIISQLWESSVLFLFSWDHLNPHGPPSKKAHTALARVSWPRWDNWLEHIIGSFRPVTWLTPHKTWIQRKERFALGSHTDQVEQGCSTDMHRHMSKRVLPGPAVWQWPAHWMDRCFNYQSAVNHLCSSISIIFSVVPVLSSPCLLEREDLVSVTLSQDKNPSLFGVRVDWSICQALL